MTATIVPPKILDAKRRERDRQRQQREALKGSILAPLDHDDSTGAPASPAREPTSRQLAEGQRREPTR